MSTNILLICELIMPISAVVNTKNSAATLPRCLESLSFVDEIVVVDMHSTDKTQEIAKKYGAKIYEFRDVGFVEPARNFAINQASYDWVLMLDTDEELPQTLQKKVLTLVERPQADVYLLARRNIIFNNWVKDAGWWPDYQPRLFKKNKLRWNETIHSRPDFFGSIQRLPANKANAIIHHNYQTISQFIQRLDRYTNIQAEQALFLGEANESASIRAFYQELSQRLFVLKGVDSCHGTILSFLQALSEFVVVAKRWEAAGFPDQKRPQASVEALKKMQQVLAYWIADYKIKHSRGLNKLTWQIRRKLKI